MWKFFVFEFTEVLQLKNETGSKTDKPKVTDMKGTDLQLDLYSHSSSVHLVIGRVDLGFNCFVQEKSKAWMGIEVDVQNC